MSRSYKAKSKRWWAELIAKREEQERPGVTMSSVAWPNYEEHKGKKRTLRADKKGNPFRAWWTDDPLEKQTTHQWERRVRKQQVLREELEEE